MSQSNHVISNEVTIPLLQRMSLGEKLHLLKNNFVTEAGPIAIMFFPLVLSSGVSYLHTLFSMIFLRRHHSSILAGYSLGLATANFSAYAVFSGLTAGAETICSQAIGAKRYKLFHATIRRGMILLFFTSLLVLLLWINMERIMTMLNQDEKLASIAQTFLFCSIPDLFARSFLHPLRANLKTRSKTLPLSLLTLLASILHFRFLSFFVSHLGFEVQGVALSNVLSNIILVAFLFIYIKKKLATDDEEEEEEEEVTEESYEDRWREWKKLFGLAIPSCGMVCLEFWCYEIMTLLCGYLEKPEVAVASMGIIIQLTSLVYIFPHSFSSVVATRVGNELGSNRPHAARNAATVGLCFSVLLAITAFTLMFAFRNVWATFFTDDEAVIDLVSKVVPIVSLCELGNCTQTTVCGVLRGSARPRTGAFINAAAFYVVGFPVAYFTAFWFEFGLMGLWLGMLAAQITCVIGMMVAMYMTDWEREAERAGELTSVDNCRRDGDDVIEDMEEAEGLISRVESLSE
ncbi:protein DETOXIFICATION 50-like [Raphanus sativus]|uniref:Protein DETOXIFICATION n=1 Tax=Raphanus sativus TaxID=3726 RepID=A0A6J0LXU0_RAPSA|nr:protein DETOXIFICATION 50-like [Raphanus sativus]